jgi:hypothetical protein
MFKKAILATALLVSAPTWAQDGGFDPGFIAGIGIGKVELSASDEEFDISLKGSDTAFHIFGGWQFTPYISGEVTYHHFGNVSDTIEGVEISVKPKGFEGAVILSTSTTARQFGVYARAGMLMWDADLRASFEGESESESLDGNDAFYGAGVWAELDSALMRVEYRKGKFDDVDMDLINLNIVWRF